MDLSTRNALLSYRAPKGKSLPLFDAAPNQIVEILNQNQTLSLNPVPMPSEEQMHEHGFMGSREENSENKRFPSAEKWAEILGLNLNPELPHQSGDDKPLLQTNLYAHSLEPQLKNIRAQANSAIEETGVNTLYLALGFLEWRETSTGKARLAPLFTLPVAIIEKDGIKDGHKIYAVKLEGDEIFSNVTLHEKLAHDFGLSLPLIGENQLPENYFSQVEQVIKEAQPKWKVKRQAYLALLNFSKQAMYQDLDPKNWPEHASLESHPLIKQLFAVSGKERSEKVTRPEEYQLDEMPDIHTKFPIIYDADSSQHSALIDAVEGKNLVIEGPPGTGKSQTITNLIAACLNVGKSVLFVAEKMAALDVVKTRLDKAGLGDFCLEIHSHKTDKKKILDDLTNSYQKRGAYHDIRQIQENINRYEAYKTPLQDYVTLVNQTWKQTGASIHAILNRAVRFRNELPVQLPAVSLKLSDSIELNTHQIKNLEDKVKLLHDIFVQVSQQSPNGHITEHYWYGVGKPSFFDYEEQQFVARLKEWNQALENLHQMCQTWQEAFGTPLDFALTEDNLKNLQIRLHALPELRGDEVITADLLHPEHLQQLSAFIQTYCGAHNKLASVQSIFKTETLDMPERHLDIIRLLEQISKICSNPQISIEDLAAAHQYAQKTQQAISVLEDELDKIRNGTPANLLHLFDNRLDSFHELSVFVGLIEQLPSHLWQHRDEVFDSPDLDSVLSQLVGVFKTLTPLHQKLSSAFHLGSLPDAVDLQNHLSVLENGGFFKLFSFEWHASKNAVISLARQTKPRIKHLQAALPDLISYKQQLDEADRINKMTPVLNQRYQGAETPIEQIQALRSWYQAVRKEYGSGFGDRVRTGSALFTVERDLAYAIRDTYHQVLHRLDKTVSDGLSHVCATFDKVHNLVDRKQNLADTEAPLQQLIAQLTLILSALGHHIADGKHTIAKITEANQVLKQAEQLNQSLRQYPVDFIPEVWTFPPTFSHFNTESVQAAQNTLSTLNSASKTANCMDALAKSPSTRTYDLLRSWGYRFGKVLANAETTGADFLHQGEVDKAAWINGKDLSGILEKI
ncbi:DUF4011 domain-containing protein [Neisseria perflava]|uniref:DUF4011 domain-containing protein n=1 Tax=Neisseria perflava TaxID=33053 RepID=UPI00209D3AE0|nr:DUF4011 domain-containing protein [Neisseria perflava]MCP1660119.1 hypothetical protein [Neisseria perflava]MCP1772747.1 hypothetical protein [Neisseria perflava]